MDLNLQPLIDEKNKVYHGDIKVLALAWLIGRMHMYRQGGNGEAYYQVYKASREWTR